MGSAERVVDPPGVRAPSQVFLEAVSSILLVLAKPATSLPTQGSWLRKFSQSAVGSSKTCLWLVQASWISVSQAGPACSFLSFSQNASRQPQCGRINSQRKSLFPW